MPTILVTGGSGFIGRHLVTALRKRGDTVRVLDVAPRRKAVGVEWIRGSVTDAGAVKAALEGVRVVYHLAAIPHLWAKNPDDYETVNVVGTRTMLEAAKASAVSRFVHCSTEAVLLGPTPPPLIDESVSLTEAEMAGPYSRSKWRAEQAALEAARQGLPVIVVNPTLPIGSGDVANTPPTAMIAHFLFSNSPFLLECTFNLIDVRDVALGMLLAAKNGRVGERYLLGGHNLLASELSRELQRLSGQTTPHRPLPAGVALAAATVSDWIASSVTSNPPLATREGVRLGMRSRPFDASKAKRELSFTPRPIGGALSNSIKWIMDQKAKAASRPEPMHDGIRRNPAEPGATAQR